MRTVLVVGVLVAVLGCSSVAGAVTQQTVDGRIDTIDRAGGVVRLIGGTVISVPPNISTVPLEPGQQITIMYRNGPDGQKIMSSFWVEESPNGPNSSR